MDYIEPAVLRELENALSNPPKPLKEPIFPDLASGRLYLVKSRSYVEVQEGSFEPVYMEFTARFTHWYTHYGEPGLDRHGKDIAVFDNRVYIGPRRNLGSTWRAQEISDL